MPTRELLRGCTRPPFTERSVLRRRPPVWIALLVGACGLIAALLLPLAPVHTDTVTLTWPAAGQPAQSTTALVVPYRPAELTARIPCAALTAAETTTVLATGPPGEGLTVTAGPDGAVLRADGLREPVGAGSGSGCAAVLHAGATGWTITGGDGITSRAEGPVPKVFGFRTDLPDPAALTVTVRIETPFATSPTVLKLGLLAVQVCAVAAALWLLGWRVRRPPSPRPSRLWWIDAAVVAILAGWAVIGPLAVDDGWAATIARNLAATGEAGNYYRWWNAPEVPFALSQQLLAPLTEISLAPLWLRVPSTLLGVATWFVLSRGILGAAIPGAARLGWVRASAALLFLAAWLPFNLGVRPESYVALGLSGVLALAWRARTPAGVAGAVLVAAVTVPISPTAVLLAAPLAVFTPRLTRVLRRAATSGTQLLATVLLLGCVGALSVSLIFADQTLAALVTATDWHREFGPNLPWYREPDRWANLLSGDQQGSAAKRLAPLLTVAMLPVVAALAWRGRGTVRRSALRLASVVALIALAYAAVPSKWSYHFGAAAAVTAAFLTVAVVLLARQRRVPGWGVVAAVGVLSAAAALAFAGPNAWWQSTVYDLPWAAEPIRPAGVPLDNPLPWLAAGALAWVLGRRGDAPATVVLTAALTSVVVLLGSFAAAPLRRPEGSLALSNLHRLTGERVCGLADDIEVLPDGPPLRPVGGRAHIPGGFPAGAPPPDPPGTGTASFVWGTYRTDDGSDGARPTGTVVTRWFTLARSTARDGLAVSVAGRTGGGNALRFEFADARGAVLASHTPVDRPATGEDPDHPLWRSIGVDAEQIPAGADRVRLTAIDGRTDEFGWLAFTGPRLRSTVGLNDFLAGLSPVLLSWPQGFLFPCVRDIPRVAAGVAETPGAVIESPRPFFVEDRDQAIGGTFAGLVFYGGLREVSARLRGHPEVDWGTVLVADPAARRDAYDLTTTREVRWGWGAMTD
ncbi:MAG: arabinosyltransferase domain-containing protein [Actinomycetota bacterium]|nr:arabinosyltransferase domain-containing protein [Actinomycetota bacterium]